MPATAKKRPLIDYMGCTDEELVGLYRAGDSQALNTLLAKYRNVTRLAASKYFLVGASKDDVVQEGMIGLYKAMRDFDPDSVASFRTFAEMCISRQIISAIKTANRRKHGPLNSYVSFETPLSDADGGGDTLADVIPSRPHDDPLEQILHAEEAVGISDYLAGCLSPLESDVLRMYVEGKTYQEMSTVTGRHTKAIDNAIQRIKKKVEGYFEAKVPA